ncbi:MAG: DUF4434 domain-containing protein [Clostridia bacterium]
MKTKTKRFLTLLLTFGIVLSCAACGNSSETNSEQKSSTAFNSADSKESSKSETSKTSSESKNDGSEDESSMEQSQKTWPYVTGTFLQPGAFASFGKNQWKTHFKNLLEVGIDTVIVQWTSTTPYGKFIDAFYPSEYAKTHKGNEYSEKPMMLENMLSVAEEMKIKVFVGLNISDEWWEFAASKSEWNKLQGEVGIESAKEIYKQKYPKALHGWYFAWEMFNGMMGYEDKAAELLNCYLDPLKVLDASMPLMLSPYVRSNGGDAKKAGEEWTKVFKTANFREGDIFCCQDAVGAGWIKIDQLDSYFSELKKAVETEKGLHFWANNENFDQSDWSSAYIDRFVQQMNIASKYVENYITFAYSHYYAKDFNNKGAFHRAYKLYYDTGMKTSFDIEKPQLSVVKSGEKIELTININQSAAGIEKVVIYGDDKVLKTIKVPISSLGAKTLKFTEAFDKCANYKVVINDYFGNKSESTINS